MVGTNMGAGNLARAQHVAWVGSGLAALVTGAVGLFGALFPHVWLGLFSKDAEVLAAGTLYLRTVGPLYGFFGLGLALYFASQGAGRLGWPLFAGFARLAIAGGGGFIAVRWLGGGLAEIFAVMAVALFVFGTVNALAVRFGAWRTAGERILGRRGG